MAAKDICTMLLDNVLALTIVLIILTSIINAIIRHRSRDKCLKDFSAFFVTLLLKNGKTIRGKMKLFSSSMELEYQQPEGEEQDGYCRNSYIMMNNELEADTQAIHRYHWDLTPKNKKLREKSIKRSYKPNLFRRIGRTMRNSVNTLRDAFNKSISLFFGQIGGKIAGGRATQELTSVGSSIVNVFGNTYEAVLEKYIGRNVIVEIVENGGKREYAGILKEYTARYLELLNVHYDFLYETEIVDFTGNYRDSQISIDKTSEKTSVSKLEIKNLKSSVISIISLKGTVKGTIFEKSIGKRLAAGETLLFPLANPDEIENLKLVFKRSRYIDMIAPRSLARVRHGGKKEKLSFRELFGIDDLSMPFKIKRMRN
ncbi:hypothetical protein ES705_11183 [subsurface metagenome]